MSENSKIEWTDHTFNPWIGCTKVSPACDHCYAERSTPARALGVEWDAHAPRYRTSAANWQKPLTWNNRPFFACRVCGWRGHRVVIDAGAPVCPNASCLPISLVPARPRVFCASLADVFDNTVDPAWRVDLFRLIANTPNLDWLLLTKRIGNARAMLNEVVDELSCGLNTWDELPWPGVWIGATIANQAEADRDTPKLLDVPARVRFLSMEPLLGHVTLRNLPIGNRHAALRFPPEHDRFDALSVPDGIDWVIVGGESGAGARPMHPYWARSLRDQCAAAGVPFLFKQWGEWRPHDPENTDHPLVADPRYSRYIAAMDNRARPAHVYGQRHEVCRNHVLWMQRVGKRAAGRLLDGHTHNEFPGEVA